MRRLGIGEPNCGSYRPALDCLKGNRARLLVQLLLVALNMARSSIGIGCWLLKPERPPATAGGARFNSRTSY